ncbi:MAG: hypothetical protein OEZ58_16595 [Gammaproteobacteria bacterium]|nr:hypothetical protein [Gammaproteobacteria bacterium]
MINIKVNIIIPCLACSLIAFGVSARTIRHEFKEEPIPEFEVFTLADNIAFQSKVRAGDVWVIIAWSSWVKKSDKWTEHWKLLLEMNEYKNRFYGLNYKDERNDAIQFLKNYGNPFSETLFDESGSVGIDLEIYGIPELMVVARNGTLAYRKIGYLDRSELQAFKNSIDNALKDKNTKIEKKTESSIVLIATVSFLFALFLVFMRMSRVRKTKCLSK